MSRERFVDCKNSEKFVIGKGKIEKKKNLVDVFKDGMQLVFDEWKEENFREIDLYCFFKKKESSKKH